MLNLGVGLEKNTDDASIVAEEKGDYVHRCLQMTELWHSMTTKQTEFQGVTKHLWGEMGPMDYFTFGRVWEGEMTAIEASFETQDKLPNKRGN